MRSSVIILALIIAVVIGCSRTTKPSASRRGGDVPISAAGGHGRFLIYGDNVCVVVNGLFMMKSGTSLTLYGDNSCPHQTFDECSQSGPVIATLSATGGNNSVTDCGTTYTLSQTRDSVTTYFAVDTAAK